MNRSCGQRSGRPAAVAAFPLILALLIPLACRREPSVAERGGASAGPQVTATVISIQTTLQPENRTLVHTIAIAGDRARRSDELDQWRLFDLKTNSVTFVDDIARTYRRESLASIVARRRAMLAGALPSGIERAEVVRGAAKRVVSGVESSQLTIRSGRYTRDLWIAEPRAIPPSLFAMMHASDTPTSSLAPMMRAADEALLALRGFPMAEHAELPLDGTKLAVDRTVTKIETRNVAESYFNVPSAYEDVTPAAKQAPARRAQ